DGATIRILDHGTASPGALHRSREHTRRERLQGRQHALDRTDAESQQRGACVRALRRSARIPWVYLQENAAEVAREVDRAAAVALLDEVETERAVKRERKSDVRGADHDQAQGCARHGLVIADRYGPAGSTSRCRCLPCCRHPALSAARTRD